MAISAKEFIDKHAGKNSEDVKIAREIEKTIDSNLQEGNNSFTYPRKLSLGVKIILIRKYKEAGWESITFENLGDKVVISLDRNI